MKGEIKAFSNEGKIGEFVTSRPTLKERPKEFSKQKGNNRRRNIGSSRRKNNEKSKIMGKYNRVSFSSWIF